MVSVSIQFDADINIYDNRHMMMTVMTGVDQLINAFAMKVEKVKQGHNGFYLSHKWH